ncbi:unnamed protein product [Darwinula stevensoni]|uniref:Uncharacterized protein n=1 Tax=Darwinula stevensoni TaxID=69355 RepID=A0A7R9FQ36_9CRUS|nr:unnamed protein product [Darwinula stevensoni]CAG0898773.1 unnamed protein product [Darwinula stevensoni]
MNDLGIPIIGLNPPTSGSGGEAWTILDGSIAQIQDIQESIQQMRDISSVSTMLQVHGGMKGTRFCASCPSLSEGKDSPHPVEDHFQNYLESEASIQRRRSHSETRGKPRDEPSLSSVESEEDEEEGEEEGTRSQDVPDGCIPPLKAFISSSSSRAGTDLHRRELHKSHSTPSIVNEEEEPTEGRRVGQPSPRFTSGTESEDELDVQLRSQPVGRIPEHAYQFSRAPIYRDEIVPDGFMAIGVPHLDDSKRRKRSSIFFKKKKEKSRRLCHTMVPFSGGRPGNCDMCKLPLFTQRSVSCQNCGVYQHEACVDPTAECPRMRLVKMTGGKSSGRLSSHSTSSLSLLSRKSPTSISPTGSLHRDHLHSPSLQLADLQLELPDIHADEELKPGIHRSLENLVKFWGELVPSAMYPQLKELAIMVLSLLLGPPTYVKVHFQLLKNRRLMDDREADFLTEDIGGALKSYLDSLTDGALEAAIANEDPTLGLLAEEPEAWSRTVDKKLILKGLSDGEIKRQEHIYEFLITEKHHCETLQLMHKLFSHGMQEGLRCGSDIIHRLFPCLEELIEWHAGFLRRLRARQKEAPIVPTIGDILVERFSSPFGKQLQTFYGNFCSQHQDAVSIYKQILKSDRRFGLLVKRWSEHPLCKKKGIPECILFVTQRITKYPLLIEPLIKTSKFAPSSVPQEQDSLYRSLAMVKDILVRVNGQVAERERASRLREIYDHIDSKSFTFYNGHKFRKSELYARNRKLKFEGIGTLVPRSGKVTDITVIVLSDVLIFLQEASNGKLHFYSQDNRRGVMTLHKMLVREKAGQDNSLYLIASNPPEVPEMVEIICQTPKDRKLWINSIRETIEEYGGDEDDGRMESGEEEEEEEALHRRHDMLFGMARECDYELAHLLEEKMALLYEAFDIHESPGDYVALMNSLSSTDVDPAALRHLLFSTVHECVEILKGLRDTGSLSSLNRSASSVGERKSSLYVTPVLPKRAETFGEIKKRVDSAGLLYGIKEGDGGDGNSKALKLVGKLSTLRCLMEAQVTSIECLRTELMGACTRLSKVHSDFGKGNKSLFQHSQRLEELRNLQDRLGRERKEWEAEKKAKEQEIEEKEKQLQALQEELKKEQEDVINQRELLFRRVEALKAQGIVLSSNFQIVPSPISGVVPHLDGHDSGPVSSPVSPSIKKKFSNPGISGSVSTSSLPQHLISATNQKKVAESTIKQQLPLKLSSTFGSSTPGSSPSQTQSMTSLNPSAPGVQQMLPFKLREDPRAPANVGRNAFAYQRMNNPVHMRSGSTPASEMGTPPPPAGRGTNIQRSGSSPSPSQSQSSVQQLQQRSQSHQDKVTDPDTNQEIYFF